MLFRILMDPVPTPGGGGGSGPPPAPAAPPAGGPDLAAILTELTDLRTYRAQRERSEADAAADKRVKDQQTLIEKGRIDDLVKQHADDLRDRQAKHDTLLARTKKTELSRSLTAALAGKPLVPGAAAQLARLWEGDFEVTDGADGSFIVRSRDLKSPDQVVTERLATREYAHFIPADSRGGAGGAGNNPPPNPDPNAPAEYKTYEDMVNAQWKAAQQAKAEGPSWMNVSRRTGAAPSK